MEGFGNGEGWDWRSEESAPVGDPKEVGGLGVNRKSS